MYVIISQGDTLEALASRYGTTALDLATVNNLEYPFVSGDPTFQKNIYATGSLTITSTQTTSQTLPVGTQFQTVATVTQPARVYATLSSVTLLQGQSSTVNVQCTVAGPYGNVLPGTVTQPVSVSGVSVTNASPISGGRILRVLIPGDQMLVPTTTTQANTTSRVPLSDADELGGTDLYVTSNGGLLFTTDDLVDVTGADCVAQDIGSSLRLPLGSIPGEPTAGTYIPSYIGQAGPYAMQRIAVLAQGAAQSDDRIASVGAVSLQQSGTWVSVAMNAVMNNGQNVPINASAQPTTGGNAV